MSAAQHPHAANRRAFLDMLAFAEIGPALLARSDDGYDVIVGSTPASPILMQGYADHPRRLVELRLRGRPVRSTAAGRYQLLARYWDHYRVRLALPDYSPASQDAVALQQIRECGALPDVDAGRLELAISRVRRIWASLPGAGYGQPERPIADLRRAYLAAGGALAPGA